jgi:broad specificity polyphosphatase/5'/3'-nucleotidase SurE
LSSGTIGAALAAAMSVPLPGPSSSTSSLHLDHIPAIAVSYGVITRPVPPIVTSLAHETAAEVCERLWNDWGYEQSSGSSKRKVQLYTVNIPLKEDVLVKENRKICWTTMWRNYYGQLFKPTKL